VSLNIIKAIPNLFQNGFGVFGITLVPQMRSENE